jgi:hypothetical protein
MNYTADQIIALAPDSSSAKAGRTLATISKWQNLGFDDRSVWGECQGSGSKPYQTAIDLEEPAFKCSCPSRKFPCKHSLGLFLLLASSPSSFDKPSPPEWVSEWLSKREQQKQRKETVKTNADAEVDEATQARRDSQRAKRALDREAKVSAGLQELELWLRDLVRAGLATAQSQPFHFWNQMAARMIDAQAPGVARRLHELSSVTQSDGDWTERMLAQIGSLFLLIKAYKHIGTLPDETQFDIRTAIGWTLKEDELPPGNLVRDEWLVLGQRTSGEEGLRVHRTWLWGKQNERGALVLDFAVAGQPLVRSFVSGTRIDADLLFYPGSFPLRAIVKNRYSTSPTLSAAKVYSTIDQLLSTYADGLSRNPWIESIPAAIESVVPVKRNERWFARDSNQKLLAMNSQSGEGWRLTALSGGHPILIAGEWNGRSLLPLGAWSDGRYVEVSRR